METAIKATCDIVRYYSRLFVNRGAYTLQSLRPHPESARHYYFRPKAKGTGEEVSLTAATIRRHLEGELTIGLYAINPANQRSKWVAIDADYAGAMEDLLKLQYFLQQDKVEAALEMSKRGGHLWIFMEKPALARECRIYIYNLALKLGVRIRGAGLAEGIEVFPKHDELREGEFGNALRGPLGIHRGANRRYWFYGADYDLEKQLSYLNRLRKVSQEQLRSFVAGKTMPPEFDRKRPSADQSVPFVHSSGSRVSNSRPCGQGPEGWQELRYSVSVLCRGQPGPQWRQLGDLHRRPEKVPLLGGLHERDDSSGGGLSHPRSAIRVRRWHMPDKQESLARRGLTLPRRVLRRLNEVGIFVQSQVSLEHQHLANTVCGARDRIRWSCEGPRPLRDILWAVW